MLLTPTFGPDPWRPAEGGLATLATARTKPSYYGFETGAQYKEDYRKGTGRFSGSGIPWLKIVAQSVHKILPSLSIDQDACNSIIGRDQKLAIHQGSTSSRYRVNHPNRWNGRRERSDRHLRRNAVTRISLRLWSGYARCLLVEPCCSGT